MKRHVYKLNGHSKKRKPRAGKNLLLGQLAYSYRFALFSELQFLCVVYGHFQCRQVRVVFGVAKLCEGVQPRALGAHKLGFGT